MEKVFEFFFELCSHCINILQSLRNRLRQTIFQNSTGNTLFRSYFDFCPYIVPWGRIFELFQLFVFFVAGYETTANTMTSILYFLAKNPQYIEKLRQEADEFEAKVSHLRFSKSTIGFIKFLDVSDRIEYLITSLDVGITHILIYSGCR